MKCLKCNKECKYLYPYHDNGFQETFYFCHECLCIARVFGGY